MAHGSHAALAAELAFLRDEIFERKCYAQEGIVLRDGDVVRGARAPCGAAAGRRSPPFLLPQVVDVGANVGLFAEFVCETCAPAAVYAFEPVASMTPAWAALTTAHPNVSLLPFAIGDHDADAVDITYFPDAPAESTRFPQQRAANVATLAAAASAAGIVPPAPSATDPPSVQHCPMVTLSTVFTKLGIATVDLLKIDVEGDELNVLRGIEPRHWPTLRQVVMEVRVCR